MTQVSELQYHHYEQLIKSLSKPCYIRFAEPLNPIFNKAAKSLLNNDTGQFITALCEIFPGFKAESLPNPLLTIMQNTSSLSLEEESLYLDEGAPIGFIGFIRISDLDKNNTELIQRLNFERTVSQISSRFVRLESDISTEINDALRELALATHASRAYVFLLRDNGTIMDNTHEWCAPFVSPQIENLQNIPTEIFPWWMKKMKNNEVINIESVSNMPTEALAEKEILESQDIQAIIVLPLYAQGECLGFIGLDNVENQSRFQDQDLILLTLTSEIFSNAFLRLQYDERLRGANENLSHTLDELRRLQAQMVHQEKMVGIGQLAAGIAHEINNPLGYVSSNFETLSKYINRLQVVLKEQKELLHRLDGVSPENFSCEQLKEAIGELKNVYQLNKIDYVLADLNDLLEDSRSGFTRVADIINSLRNFARSEGVVKHSPHHLLQIIDEVLLILGNEIKYAAQVEKHIDPSAEISCNRSEIGQVVMNLILNAIQAIKADDTLTTGHIVIESFKEEGYTVLTITDDGIGVSSDSIHQIFDPFYTTKEVGTGTGLGLSISYDIMVNKHNGLILVNSEPGIGTTFTLKFKDQ